VVSSGWQEPVLGAVTGSGGRRQRSLIDPTGSGWAVPAMFEKDGSLHVRLFNAGGDNTPRDLVVGVEAEKIELVELDGRVIERLEARADERGRRVIRLSIPRFGIRTLRFSHPKSPSLE
jgi:alpha-mannosidase